MYPPALLNLRKKTEAAVWKHMYCFAAGGRVIAILLIRVVQTGLEART